jgi:hypothetical protein
MFTVTFAFSNIHCPRYMHRLFDAARYFVIVYASNVHSDNSRGARHVRHRKFTDWVEEHATQFDLYMHSVSPASCPIRTSSDDVDVTRGQPHVLIDQSTGRLTVCNDRSGGVGKNPRSPSDFFVFVRKQVPL